MLEISSQGIRSIGNLKSQSPKGRIWQSNDGSLPILTIAVRLVEKQEQEELEEEEALQRAIEAVLAQNKRDYRQDIKTGRI